MIDQDDNVNDVLRRLEARVEELFSLLTQEPTVKGPGYHERKPEATRAQMHELYIKRAHQMRQGKLAKRLGMTRAEFAEKFGDVTSLKELERRHPETKFVLLFANEQTAKRARVGRVAKQYGIPFAEWVALHGMRDVKLPRGADPRESTLQKAKKRRKKVNGKKDQGSK